MLCKYIKPTQLDMGLNKEQHNQIFTYALIVLLLLAINNKTIFKKQFEIFFKKQPNKATTNTLLSTQKTFTPFAAFLKKKIHTISVRAIIKTNVTKTNQKISKRKLKLSRMHWKNVKKIIHRNKIKLHTKFGLFISSGLRGLKTFKISKKIKTRSLKKRLLLFYKTRRRFNMAAYRNRYKNWIKNNKINHTYSTIYSKFNTRTQVNKMHNMLLLLTRRGSKRRTSLIIKRKIMPKLKYKLKLFKYNSVLKGYSKKTILTVSSNLFFAKINNFKNYYKNLTPLNSPKMLQKLKNTSEVSCARKPLYLCISSYQLPIKRENIKNDRLNSKREIKSKIFSTLFDVSTNNHYNINSVPTQYLSGIPQLLLKVFSNTKKNNNAHESVNEYFDNVSTTVKQDKSTLITKLRHNTAKNAVNNYFPLYMYGFICKNKYTDQLIHKKTQNYYYNVNVLATTKYKMFFIFFLVNFLENMLQKKMWIRINSKDPIGIFWKSYITAFLKKHNYLFKKFNKLISVRELLEILWIVFKTHDLTILLTFLKKKIENAHFKKHKKILSIFFDVLRKNEYLFKVLKIKGFFFDIRGKVGVSGNAKKRHSSFSIGKITTTSQNLGSYFQQMNIWTPTGQMGVTCIIQY